MEILLPTQILKINFYYLKAKKHSNGLILQAKRGFCNKCGASIFFKFKNSKTTSISAGMFSKSLKLKSSKNIFVKNRLKFYKVDNSMPKFNRYSNK